MRKSSGVMAVTVQKKYFLNTLNVKDHSTFRVGLMAKVNGEYTFSPQQNFTCLVHSNLLVFTGSHHFSRDLNELHNLPPVSGQSRVQPDQAACQEKVRRHLRNVQGQSINRSSPYKVSALGNIRVECGRFDRCVSWVSL